jgi:hypothetical protein
MRSMLKWYSALLVLLSISLAAACSDAQGLAGPEATAPETPIPVFEKAHGGCAAWSCAIAICGWDPATDPRGACCLAINEGDGEGSWEKPSCSEGSGGIHRSGQACWNGAGCCGPTITPYDACAPGTGDYCLCSEGIAMVDC